MKELISKSFIEKQCKTCKVKHTYQTVGAVNVQELNKKIRSSVMPSELRRFFNKKNDFLNCFGSDDVLLNPMYTQCLLRTSLISLSKFNWWPAGYRGTPKIFQYTGKILPVASLLQSAFSVSISGQH